MVYITKPTALRVPAIHNIDPGGGCPQCHLGSPAVLRKASRSSAKTVTCQHCKQIQEAQAGKNKAMRQLKGEGWRREKKGSFAFSPILGINWRREKKTKREEGIQKRSQKKHSPIDSLIFGSGDASTLPNSTQGLGMRVCIYQAVPTRLSCKGVS